MECPSQNDKISYSFRTSHQTKRRAQRIEKPVKDAILVAATVAATESVDQSHNSERWTRPRMRRPGYAVMMCL